jgi:hypothetical protein
MSRSSESGQNFQSLADTDLSTARIDAMRMKADKKNKITENDERRRKDVFKEIGRQKCWGKHITGNIYLLTVLWIRN